MTATFPSGVAPGVYCSTSSFIGNILALTSITLNGRALAQTGAVTLDANTITGPTCIPALPNTGVETKNSPNILLTLSALLGITIIASVSLIIRQRRN